MFSSMPPFDENQNSNDIFSFFLVLWEAFHFVHKNHDDDDKCLIGFISLFSISYFGDE